MQELNMQEIDAVSGGAVDVNTAIGVTLGLMAIAPLSVAVVTAGTVALTFYVSSKLMQ